MVRKREEVLQVEQLFLSGSPAIAQSLFHLEASEDQPKADAVPECAGQLSLTQEES